MKKGELLSPIYRILPGGVHQCMCYTVLLSNQLRQTKDPTRRGSPMHASIFYVTMPAPIREQGNAGTGCLLQSESREMPVQDACSNQRAGNAGIGCLLQLESREMPVLGNEGYTTVGNPTLGMTSILTKLRWDGGMIQMIVIRAMLVIQAMLLIQVCYNRLRAMILQATGHDTTGYEP